VEVEVDTPGHLCPWSAVSELRANCSHVDVSLVGGEGGLVGFLQGHCPAGESDGCEPADKGEGHLWAPGHLDTATLSCAIAETPKGLSVEPLYGAPCRRGGRLRVTSVVFACAHGRSQIWCREGPASGIVESLESWPRQFADDRPRRGHMCSSGA
jgi:hypothetical protein